ncbi:AfsR/SARP family transcriptional regulator [Lentzea pudingi]|uniref:AfsR/SARP family transcriptional regulator n=1 Tax=Lentzea pudingi TaxID=1789439 RepID=UPI00166C44D8|nr:BTAD domain-containing putative transcriptional regulator [Lentzea pudingi]
MATDIQFQILGPLEVSHGGRPIRIASGKQRVVLALLLLRRNRTVSIDELVDKLWGWTPPADAKGVVQKYVHRLRHLLPDGVIRTEPGGYRIDVSKNWFDLDGFIELVERSKRSAEADDAEAEATLLRAALGLWRSRLPLADVPSEPLHRNEIPQLVEQYLQTLERRIEVDLSLGRHGEVVGELMGLVHDHPLRERFWTLSMRALHGAGRQGEALVAYRKVVRLLADELGVGPGAELSAAYQQILQSGADGEAESAIGPEGLAGADTKPRQLPTAGTGFVGRRRELVGIMRAMVDVEASVPLVVVSGVAGVGKTTLAVHAAHAVAGSFDEGHLYADLRGYAQAAPLTTEQVLGHFLRALGVESDAIPLNLTDLVAVYRSRLSGRKVLILLDNVSDETQVRALLPGSAGSAVIVTSRNELAGLVVSPGAQRFTLDALDTGEGRELLAKVIGEARVAREEQAVVSLVGLCGGLALALRVAGAHLVLRPDLKIEDYLDQLRDQKTVLALRVAGDDQTSLSAAFDWSYQWLTVEQRQMLRLLSLVAGPSFSAQATAALCAIDVHAAAVRLEQMAASSLVMRTSAHRYHLHDLIRNYALIRCSEEEPEADRNDARLRLLDHYIAVADAATGPLVSLSRLSRPLSVTAVVVDRATVFDMDSDRASMVAAVINASERGMHESAYHLADALRGYFTLRGHTADWLACVNAGLPAAQAAGDHEAIAAMLNSRGVLSYYAGDTDAAIEDMTAALKVYERIGSPSANAARINLGVTAQVSGDLEASVQYLRDAVEGYAAQGELGLERRARQNLVLAQLGLGELEQAANECAMLRATSEEPADLLSLGVTAVIAKHVGNLSDAARMLTEAVAEAEAQGDYRTEIGLRDELASCQLERGNDEEGARLAVANLAKAEQHDSRNVANAKVTLAEVLRRSGHLDGARTHYEEAFRVACDSATRHLECDALVGLAAVALDAGDVRTATVHAAEAVARAEEPVRRLSLIRALVTLARCLRAGGELGQAKVVVLRALGIARDCKYVLGQGQALEELARVDYAAGETETAERELWEARFLYAQIGSRRVSEVTEGMLVAAHPINTPPSDGGISP